MKYSFLDEKVNSQDFVLQESSKINHYLLKDNNIEILKALEFLVGDGKFLYIHGFLGTGKRQFINYTLDFVNKEVIQLKYICKPSTVCDDILIAFIDIVEKHNLSKAVNHTAKITTLSVKLQQYISSIKKPFIITLESYDDIEEGNRKNVEEFLQAVLKEENVKVILSTRAMIQDIIGGVKEDKKIFIKGFSKEIFKEFVKSNQITGTEAGFEDFYKLSRGYYYYTALAIKIMQAMNVNLNDFLAKVAMSGSSFDSYLGMTYVNLIPNTIRNFFWFLRLLRHGISINALAILELYDEFSIGYLKNNLMIFQEDEILYVQDYFQQDIDISIPTRTEIKLHKYIVGIYEKELKEPLQTRSILISKLALKSEINYHKERISELQNNTPKADKKSEKKIDEVDKKDEPQVVSKEQDNLNNRIAEVKKLAVERKYTDAIEGYKKIIDEFKPDKNTLAELRVELGRLYYSIKDYSSAQHYYELAESYYEKQEEFINLNYLYYELINLYFSMYKIERAVDTAKKVIYSVDTPQSLMVDSCIRLGNIYTDMSNLDEAYKYYSKAIESVDENISNEEKSELYFKFALVCDEREDEEQAFEYYNKCLMIEEHNSYKAAAYSNLGSCYYDKYKMQEAEDSFLKAYSIEKENNNYEGIYYVVSYLAKIYNELHDSEKAYKYLVEAKQCAEFINEDYYVLEATIALGDYYYDHKNMCKEAFIEYLIAKKLAENMGTVELNKIQERINDMQLRMNEFDVSEIEEKYGK